MRVMIFLVTLGLSASPLVAADETFAGPVTVSREGPGYRIEFAARTPTAVEVAVLNQAGRVVRHLAAGVLGANAPAPLRKDSLRQALTWDGNDDRGRPAAGGPFRARVRLGPRPALEAVLGDNPAALGTVRSLAVGPGGELFVFHVFGELHPNDGTPTCAVFDRDGKYLRTILPFPAGLPAERWKGLRRLTREDASRVPFLYQAETRSLLPGAGDLPPHRSVATRDGRVAFVGVREGPHRYAQAGVNQVLVIRADGGVPESGFRGPELAALAGSAASLALAPDETTVYATGLREGSSDGKPNHAVYAFRWADPAPRLFVGNKTEAGAGRDRLDTPRSVAVDGKGNVYVADRGNDRVAVFAPDGTFRGEVTVERPERVEVHPQTGALYVLGGPRVDRLVKFAGWDRPAPVAELTLPSFKHPNYTVLLALDASHEPPVLWASSPMGRYAKFDLYRIEDRGMAFAAPVDVGRRNQQQAVALGPVLNLEYDRRQRRLFANTELYDLAKGAWHKGLNEASGKSTNAMGVGGMGLDGNFYAQIYPNIVRRIGPDLKRLPFAGPHATAKGDLLSPFVQGTMRVRGRGVTADAEGNLYVLWEDTEHFTRGQAYNQLYVHGSDGSVKKPNLIEAHLRSLDSVRVDPAGNVYLALGLRPGKDLLPPGLIGQVPDGPKDVDAVGGLNSYPLIYGSIAKFGPGGGVIRRDCGGVPCNHAFGSPVEVKGAQWIFSGASPVVSWRTPGTPDICNCESARFDVDEYGRSFFPDAARCRVGMLDTAGNLIGWFGGYGNVDAAGAKGRAATPDVPLLWPYCVAAGDDGVFVGDRLNRRVLHVKLQPAAEETRPLP